MSNLSLIISHEYRTRVMKPSFLLLSILTPVLFVALMIVPTWLMTRDGSQHLVMVNDQSGLYADSLENTSSLTFVATEETAEELIARDDFDQLGAYAILTITGDLLQDGRATLESEKQIDMSTQSDVSDQLTTLARRQKLASYHLPEVDQIINDSRLRIEVETKRFDQEEGDSFSATMAMLTSTVMGLLIVMFIMICGSQVMQGVIQEKNSRVVEILVSCAKPFDLMMGKIIAIALVALTQMALWVVLGGVLGLIGLQFVPGDPLSAGSLEAASKAVDSEVLGTVLGFLGGNFLWQAVLFVVLFIGGYLLYASLFAGVGSMVENETDSQQLTLPVTVLILFAMYAGMYVAENPDTTFAFWTSLFPFTSPVVMMARMSYGVAAWEVVLSVVLLYLTAVGSVWFSGKLYRKYILLFGKKFSWKQLLTPAKHATRQNG